jgi:hypothetical protein
VDWIDLFYGMQKWPALPNAVMNFQVLYNAGNFLAS